MPLTQNPFFSKDNKIEDDYRGLYRLYRAALKALKTLEREWYLRNQEFRSF